MDEMRNRYRLPRKDFGLEPPRRSQSPPKNIVPEPAVTIHDSLKHAYQPPPQPRQEAAKPRHPQPIAVPAAVQRPKARPKKQHLVRTLLITVLVLGILGGAGAWAYPKYAHKNPFPADIRSSAAVGLFYPQKLPAGYTINSASIHLENGVLTYNANNGSLRVVFTTQPIPTAFDYPAFKQKYLNNAQQISTVYGQAAVGQNQGRSLGSLVSGNSWFILSTNNAQISQDNLRLIINSLKKY